MKKLVLLALLAIALPTAAFADTIDYGNTGGTLTGSAATGFTVNSTLTTIKDFTTNSFTSGANLGSVVLTTGAVSGGAFTGGSITIMVGSTVIFSSSLANGTVTTSNGLTTINANLACFSCGSFQQVIKATGQVTSGDTIVTPEPGTLGLLGTGLVGLAGIVRRKLHA